MFLKNFSSFFSTTRRISIGMAVLRIFKSILTLWTISLSAKYFGMSLERDAWVIGGTAVTFFTGFIFGPITNVFRTKFVHIREEQGEESALKATSALMGGIITISLLIIILFEIFPLPLCKFFAPGFNVEETQVLIVLVRWLLPTLLLGQVTSIWTAVLNTYNSFFLPDIFGFISGILNVLLIVFLAEKIGVFSLVISGYLSSLLLLLMLFRTFKNRDIRAYRFHVNWTHFKPYVLFALPMYINYFAGQFLSIVERRICSLLPSGAVSAFDYGKRFGDLTLNVILSIVPMVITPILATHFAKRSLHEFKNEFLGNLRLFLIGAIPIVTTFVLCARDIVAVLFKSATMDPSLVNVTINTLFWMGVGIVGVILYVIAGEAIIAQKRVKYVTVTSSFAYIIIMIFDYFLYKKYGAWVLASTWALIHLVLGSVLCIFGIRIIERKQIVKEILIIGLFYLIVITLTKIFLDLIDTSMINQTSNFLRLLTVISLSVLILISAIILSNSPEKQFLKRIFSK